MIKTYRKKPVEIEAAELTAESVDRIKRWIGTKFDSLELFGSGDIILRIETLEGVITARQGDYIIRGVKGEFYPCKPDIFEMTYTEVPFFMEGVPLDGA